MQLAWTAGPVTYIALQGGYLLGYGKTAPPNMVIYFAIYTIIAGIFAIIIRFLYQLTKGQEIEKAEESIRLVFSRLPNLIFFTRDQILRYYDIDNRQLLAAKYLLENPDASPETIRTAVFDITKDDSLADAAKQIEIFRGNGLFARIEDLYAKVIPKTEKKFNSIKSASPIVEELIRLRLQGLPPNRQVGRVRTEGFIGRVLSAAEKHNLELMSLSDAEEIFTLIYELLADRTIPVFSLKYIGSNEFIKTSENFDKARYSFRKAAYLRNSKLRSLADLLADSKPIDIVPAAAPVITTLTSMYEHILQAIDDLHKKLKKQIKTISPGKRKSKISAKLKKDLLSLESTVQLHHSLKNANDTLERNFQTLKLVELKYLETEKKAVRRIPLHILESKESGSGIKIIQKQIALSKNSKIRIVKVLNNLLQMLDSKEQVRVESKNIDSIIQTDEYKKLAIDIAMLLEDELKLSRFEIQLAIEGSNAPFLSSSRVEPTAAAETGKAVSKVGEVQVNVKTPIQKLAYSLVNYHGMPLDKGSINLLVQKYNADPNILEKLSPGHQADKKEEGEDSRKTVRAVKSDPFIESGSKKYEGVLKITNLDDKYQELINIAIKLHIL